jgi:hypothetical protein
MTQKRFSGIKIRSLASLQIPIVFAALLLSNTIATIAQQTPSTLSTYEQAMNRIAQPELDRRKASIEQIHTRAQADARQASVRATLLRLIGGLPDNHGPLNATVVGTMPEDGFRIEKIIYDSLPGYHVTANLYLPASGKGPFPAVIYSAGHAPFGKAEAFGLGSNLARNGIAVPPTILSVPASDCRR